MGFELTDSIEAKKEYNKILDMSLKDQISRYELVQMLKKLISKIDIEEEHLYDAKDEMQKFLNRIEGGL